MRYAFIDECGSTALFLPEDPVLVLAAVVTVTPRRLEIIARHAFRRLDRPAAEIKASKISRSLLNWILSAVASEPLAVAYVCIDKRGATRKLDDPEELYRLAARQLVVACLGEWPSLRIVFDRRYTRGYLLDRFERSLRGALDSVPGTTANLSMEDSLERKELQIADCVASAIARRFRSGDNSLYLLIVDQVVFGEIIHAA